MDAPYNSEIRSENNCGTGLLLREVSLVLTWLDLSRNDNDALYL